jgi:hypothetical protein
MSQTIFQKDKVETSRRSDLNCPSDWIAWLALAMLFALLVMPGVASAEKCWLAGCAGDIGYVYVPESQISIRLDTMNIDHDNSAYKLDISGKIFKEYGLPPIGTIATLAAHANLLPYYSISKPEVAVEIEKPPFIYHVESKGVSIYQYRFDDSPGNLMAPGARLEILGYLGDRGSGRSNLFALVAVKSD